MAVESMTAARRRLLFGFNVGLQVVLATVAAVALVWVAGRFKARADWTATGINSLSPRTIQLLRNLDQNIRITALFAEPDRERQPVQAKRYREIRDLLELYESAGGGRVTTQIIEPTVKKAETERLLERLRRLPAYAEEAKPHEQALSEFPALNQRIKELASTEFQKAQELASADARLAQNRNFNIVRRNWQIVAQQADSVAERISELTQAEVPRYGQATSEARQYLNDTKLRLQDASSWMAEEAGRLAGAAPELQSFFEQAPQRYHDVLSAVDGLLQKLEGLKEIKLEEVYNELTRWRTGPPVLVESEKEAKVIPNWEIWEVPREPGAPLSPEGDDRVFVGEQAISSAILHLTQKEKLAVVFTYYGGSSPIKPDFSQANPFMRQMPTAPYQQLSELLQKANFVVEEWDVSKQKTPPTPKDAARSIYVVLPPEPPNRPNPMEPAPQRGISAEDKKAIEDAIASSKMAVFLVGWRQEPTPFGGALDYEFAEYLKNNWGVEVRARYLVLQFAPNPQKGGWWVPATREPWVITTDGVVRLTDHDIGRPSRADRAGFRFVVPLEILPPEKRPQGVVAEVVAEIGRTDDVWAVEEPMRLDEQLRRYQGVRPAENDYKPPFAIAVAAHKPDGSRLVVFGSEHFATDSMAQASGLTLVGNALVLGPLYPANSDLFINALHWASGEANRIAVGPRRADLPRLSELDEKWARRLPYFLVGIWPAIVLLIGLGIFLLRRR
jgi:hypothetical protein